MYYYLHAVRCIKIFITFCTYMKTLIHLSAVFLIFVLLFIQTKHILGIKVMLGLINRYR